MHPKIVDRDRLLEIREGLRRDGKVLVQCHGCFDIVHPGHIRYLAFAKTQGDVLLVSVSSDRHVNKGYDRPFINESLRAENLAVLEFVDYVYVDDHDWAGPILSEVEPDVYIKGKEYESHKDPRFLKERQIVEEYGGTVVFSSGDVVFSSTQLINQFRDRFSERAQRLQFYCSSHGITLASINEAMGAFWDKRFLVVGDPIMDVYTHCTTAEVAEEAPIISVTPLSEESYVGGAGLVALQLAQLGADTTFLTTRADEETHAAAFDSLLATGGVHAKFISTPRRSLFQKQRMLVGGQKVVKINRGQHAPLSGNEQREFMEKLVAQGDDLDGLILLDFGYGMFGEDLIRDINEFVQKRELRYYVDVSQRGSSNLLKYRGARIATPTEQELRFALGDRESGLSNLAARFLAATQTRELLLTLGDRGAIRFHPSTTGSDRLATDYLPALADHAVDAIGAGDVFLAGSALCDAAGLDPRLALYFSSCLSALQIGRLGNSPSSAPELQSFLLERAELRESR
ncbi:MAG: adenylyltransferase/cytidyltransferase family protein [Deltaproteobacteria bacterium]|nr:adenylyltransferase/cytidyltransferase family protein [Deltaproteobacteria bacterium]